MKYLKILSLLFLFSCASSVSVNYVTDPPGAKLYEGEKYLGTSPVRLEYQITNENRKEGKVRTRPVWASWVSGANSEELPGEFDINESTSWTVTIDRPKDHPNRLVDEQHGIEVQKLKIQQQQLQFQQQKARAEAYRNISNSNKNKPKSCYADYDCGRSSKCAKKEGAYQGICVDILYVD